MATQVQRRRGSTVQHSTFTGAVAELTVDTTLNTVVVHDGATAGGHPLAKVSDLPNMNAVLETTDIGVLVQAYDVTTLKAADIGTSVQGYDVDTAKLDVANNWTASQRSAPITDNDASFDLSGAGNNYTCTPTGAFAITFTNIASNAGKSGYITIVNGSNYVATADANTKVATTDLTTLSATGTHKVPYFCDGTYVDILGVWTRP